MFFDKNITKILKDLDKETFEATSSDGAVTLIYNGIGECKDIKINTSLDELDKSTLEKDIVDVFQYMKNKLALDLGQKLMSGETQEENNEDVS